jgi:PAS domain S-box-containing protein
VASADAELRFVYLNRAWERVLGWRPEELAGSRAIDLLHADDRDALVRASAGGREAELAFDCRVTTRDGRWRWMSWELRHEDGCWYIAAHDATDRHERLAEAQRVAGLGSLDFDGETGAMERRLAAREAQLRALVEQVPAIVYTAGFGADAPWDYVSPQIETLLGYSAAEWAGRRELWWEALHPDDRAAALEDEQGSARPGGQLRSEYRLRRRDGSWVWVRDEATVIENEHGEARFQGVLLDITERKRAEAEARAKHAQLQAVIDNSPLLIWAKDRDHRYLFANLEHDVLGPADGDPIAGRRDLDFLPAEQAGEFMASDREVRGCRLGARLGQPGLDEGIRGHRDRGRRGPRPGRPAGRAAGRAGLRLRARRFRHRLRQLHLLEAPACQVHQDRHRLRSHAWRGLRPGLPLRPACTRLLAGGELEPRLAELLRNVLERLNHGVAGRRGVGPLQACHPDPPRGRIRQPPRHHARMERGQRELG